MVNVKDLSDDEAAPTYNEWEGNLKHGYNRGIVNSSWITIGDWLINAKDNDTYDNANVAYHICVSNYNRIYHSPTGNETFSNPELASVAPIEDGCRLCKTPMPDGIKMIALLEKL